jgi:hypothetical protein
MVIGYRLWFTECKITHFPAIAEIFARLFHQQNANKSAKDVV